MVDQCHPCFAIVSLSTATVHILAVDEHCKTVAVRCQTVGIGMRAAHYLRRRRTQQHQHQPQLQPVSLIQWAHHGVLARYWQRCVIAVRAVKNVYSRPVLFVVHISSLLDVYHLCSSLVSAARDLQVGMLNFNSPLSVLISLLIFTVSVFELFLCFHSEYMGSP